MRFVTATLVIFISLILVACAGTSAGNFAQARDPLASSQGIILTSIGTAQSPSDGYGGYFLKIRNLRTKDIKIIEVIPRCILERCKKMHLQVPSGITLLHAASLEAGDYELFQVGAGSDLGTTTYGFQSKENFSYRFSIISNEITYLGSYLHDPRTVGISLVTKLPPGPYVVSNELERDKAKFIESRPEFSSTKITSSLPGQGISPLLVIK